MRFGSKTSVFLGLTIAWLISWVSTAQASSPETKSAKVNNSEIRVTSVPRPGTKIKSGRAEAVIDERFDRVVKVVTDYGSYAGFLPHFKVSRVLAKRGANAIVYLEASVMKNTFKIWAQSRFRSLPSEGKTKIIEGKMTKGNVRSLSARWELTPLSDNRTRVVFQMFFDPDLPIPAFIVSDQNATAARRTIRSLRKKVHQIYRPVS
jgi:ribosome-associated toxin RatA of RatAB toxin-antitoxin module